MGDAAVDSAKEREIMDQKRRARMAAEAVLSIPGVTPVRTELLEQDFELAHFRAVKAEMRVAALHEALASLLDCQILGAGGCHKGWRIAAGSDHGGGLTQRAAKARAVLLAT